VSSNCILYTGSHPNYTRDTYMHSKYNCTAVCISHECNIDYRLHEKSQTVEIHCITCATVIMIT